MTWRQARLLISASNSAQRICSTAGRSATTLLGNSCSSFGPVTCKRSDFDANSVRIRVVIWFGEADSERLGSAERRQTLKDRVRECFLQIVSPGTCYLGHLPPHEVVIPSARRIVAGRRSEIVEPDLYAHEKALRRPNLEVMEAYVRLNLERIEQDPRGADLQ